MSEELQKSVLRSNSTRRSEFRTHTEITDAGEKKVIRKYASTQQAVGFLKIISEREQKSADYLNGHFDVLCGTLKDNYIEYEYLPFSILEDLIQHKMSEGDIQEVNNLFDKYVNKTSSLEIVNVYPVEFLKTIVDEKNTKEQSFNCLKMGLVDLTPRNIMVNGDKWIVFDNEWSFDFSVPVEFILFRTVREMAILLQDEIRNAASDKMPVTNFFAFGLTRFFVPVHWLECLKDYAINFPRMFQWELGFQRYVRGNDCKSAGRITNNSMKHMYELPIKSRRKSKMLAGLKSLKKILPVRI